MKFPTPRHFLALAAALLSLAGTASVASAKERILTLWPLVDYRRSDATDYTSLSLLGPFLSFERKGSEREYALRPLYFRAADPEEEISFSELLYPVGSRKDGPEHTSFQGVRLLSYDADEREGGKEKEFMLFPFLFSGTSPDGEDYFAFFPIGGKLVDKFWRDEIRFALFPIYGRTERKGTVVTNILWPVFAKVEGEREKGIKLWPLYGASRKEGVYEKRFFLWPVFFREDLGLDTDNPRHRRAAFPLYLEEESPRLSSRTWLWPFFSHVENREKDYEEWNFPWPLLRRTTGSYREGVRALPLYADEKVGATRKRWFLWPVYKIEEIRTETMDRRRDRVLFFLYSDLKEAKGEVEKSHLRRIALWPLFTYEREGAVSRFHTLSLLEPFFPDRGGVERNWSPLYRLYQRKWDEQGNEVSSLLWNLYWKERRGDDVAMEFFPLFFFRREGGEGTELSLLKGALRYRGGEKGRKVHLLFLPWGIPVGGGPGPGES